MLDGPDEALVLIKEPLCGICGYVLVVAAFRETVCNCVAVGLELAVDKLLHVNECSCCCGYFSVLVVPVCGVEWDDKAIAVGKVWVCVGWGCGFVAAYFVVEGIEHGLGGLHVWFSDPLRYGYQFRFNRGDELGGTRALEIAEVVGVWRAVKG